ncbi:MAG: tetratricopeptide repeat protein [Alphaproteobacteria bacterium]
MEWLEASRLTLKAVLLPPASLFILLLLGLLAYRLGKFEEAVVFIQQALEIVPDLAEAHSDLGVVLCELNRLEEARRACETAISLNPALHPAYSNLGNVLKSQGDYEGAAEAYRKALAISPDYASAHANLGVVLINLGQPEEALAACSKGVELAPNRADTHVALGHVLRHTGNIDEAMATYLRAIDLNPSLASVYSDLGCLLQEKGEWDAAMQAHEKALTMQPNNARILNNIGVTLKALGRYTEAEQHYRKALTIEPDYADAHSNLGATLYSMNRMEEAIAAYRHATKLDPRALYAHVNLAAALLELDQMPEAIDMYGKALAIDPDFPAALAENYNLRRQTCDWRDVAALEEKLLTKTYRIGKRIAPFQLLNVPCGPEEHLACAREWVKGFVKPVETPFVHKPNRGGPIRIGYLSADFYEHATANLITELLERHDRSRFEVAGYCFSRDDGSRMRKRLIAAFDNFVSISEMSHAEAARHIYADGVDILVDLKGFTSDTRTEILTCRPAPIQVNYLGYPGTLGADFIDYIIGDAFLTPMDQAEYYQEKIVQLPGSYQPNDTKRTIAAETPTRAECGLPEEGFVFCCFNGPYKITPHQFSVWMQLLRETPNSVLWLLEGNSQVRDNLSHEAEALGVSASRLVFSPKINLSQHLARHRLADLFLDSSPINAHTTASDALWAGCPVLTLAGDTFVSRVAGSLLRAVGLPELIARTEDEYIATALRLARDPDALTAIREKLISNHSSTPLFNIQAYTANIERAFEHMVELFDNGHAPEAFAVTDLSEAKPRAKEREPSKTERAEPTAQTTQTPKPAPSPRQTTPMPVQAAQAAQAALVMKQPKAAQSAAAGPLTLPLSASAPASAQRASSYASASTKKSPRIAY